MLNSFLLFTAELSQGDHRMYKTVTKQRNSGGGSSPLQCKPIIIV